MSFVFNNGCYSRLITEVQFFALFWQFFALEILAYKREFFFADSAANIPPFVFTVFSITSDYSEYNFKKYRLFSKLGFFFANLSLYKLYFMKGV